MTRFEWRLRQLAFAGVLAGCIGSTAAAPAELIEEDAEIASGIQSQLSRIFSLPKALALDPGLRAAAEKIGADHLQRTEAQLPAWINEERSVQKAATGRAKLGWMHYALMARVLNELAYWHLEPGDAEYEQATIEVLKTSPLVCQTGSGLRVTDFSSRILRIQAMPPARQKAALATEARLLERWGKPRPAALPWPTPLPQDAAMAAVAQIVAGGKRPAVPLPPSLAWRLLSERDNYDQLHDEFKCAVHRWWLQESLTQGQPQATALNTFRYGTLITANDRFGDKEEAESGDAVSAIPAYPKLAARFDVTGVTKVTRSFNAAGKPEHASITDRRIKVAGIRGARPIVFETVFDKISLQHALRPVDAVTSDKQPETYELVWTLESSKPTAAKKAAPEEKKR